LVIEDYGRSFTVKIRIVPKEEGSYSRQMVSFLKKKSFSIISNGPEYTVLSEEVQNFDKIVFNTREAL